MYWGSVSPGDRGKKDKFRSPQFRFFKSQFKTYLTMTTNFEKDTNSQVRREVAFEGIPQKILFEHKLHLY